MQIFTDLKLLYKGNRILFRAHSVYVQRIAFLGKQAFFCKDFYELPSHYIDELGGNAFENRYYDKQFFLDANASYKITSQLRLFAEANNLTNHPLRYYQEIQDRAIVVFIATVFKQKTISIMRWFLIILIFNYQPK